MPSVRACARAFPCGLFRYQQAQFCKLTLLLLSSVVLSVFRTLLCSERTRTKSAPPGNLVFGSRLVSQEEWYGPVPMASIPHLRIVRIVRMRASKKKRTALVYLHKTNEKQFASPKLSFQTTWEKRKSRTRDKPEYPRVGYSTEEERTGRKMMR